MRPVAFLPLADDDLVAAWLHIATDNPTAADNYLDHIHNVCSLVPDNPEMGVDREELGDCVRSFLIENHVIFYVANVEGITVLRIWPSAQDPATFIL